MLGRDRQPRRHHQTRPAAHNPSHTSTTTKKEEQRGNADAQSQSPRSPHHPSQVLERLQDPSDRDPGRLARLLPFLNTKGARGFLCCLSCFLCSFGRLDWRAFDPPSWAVAPRAGLRRDASQRCVPLHRVAFRMALPCPSRTLRSPDITVVFALYCLHAFTTSRSRSSTPARDQFSSVQFSLIIMTFQQDGSV